MCGDNSIDTSVKLWRPVYALGLDNETGYGVVSDYAIAYANVYAIGYVSN